MSVVLLQAQRRGSWPLMVVVLTVAVGLFFERPLALLVFACLLAVVSPTDDFKWFLLIAVCALFATLNVSRQVDGDLVNYVDLQQYIAQLPFYGLLQKEELQILSGTYRMTEIGYYAPLWLTGQIIQDSRVAVTLTATIGIYIPTFMALITIGRAENWSRGLMIAVALFTFFAGINFVQSTHLIRQYISSAFLFYAAALFIADRRRWALICALYACTIHNGTAMIIPLVTAVCWLFPYREARIGAARITVGVLVMLLLLAGTIAIVPILQGTYIKEDVPNIKVVHFVVVGTLFLTTHIVIQWERIRLRSIYYARLAFFVIYILSLGFFVLGLPLFALRYFAYLEWLYGLLVGAVMFGMFRNSPPMQMFVRFAVCIAASAILIARINVSEWKYGPGDNNFMSWDFLQVAQLVGR
jgi:hypothetical protein